MIIYMTLAERVSEARDIAFTDPLTRVKSKHSFAIQEGKIETRINDDEVFDFGVIVCDVNGLKRISDTLGHKAEDEYIISTSRMLCVHFKSMGAVIRD